MEKLYVNARKESKEILVNLITVMDIQAAVHMVFLKILSGRCDFSTTNVRSCICDRGYSGATCDQKDCVILLNCGSHGTFHH